VRTFPCDSFSLAALEGHANFLIQFEMTNMPLRAAAWQKHVLTASAESVTLAPFLQSQLDNQFEKYVAGFAIT